MGEKSPLLIIAFYAVAMVQQDPVVMADTFLANVTLGRDVSEAQVAGAGNGTTGRLRAG